MQTCIFMNNIFNFLNISQFIFRTFLRALCLDENSMNSLVFLYIHVDKNQGVHLLYMACVRCWGLTFQQWESEKHLSESHPVKQDLGLSKMGSCRAFSIRL